MRVKKIFVYLFLIVLYACACEELKYQRLYTQALQKSANKDYVSAIEILQQIPKASKIYDRAQNKIKELRDELQKKLKFENSLARVKYTVVRTRQSQRGYTTKYAVIPRSYTMKELLILAEKVKRENINIYQGRIDFFNSEKAAIRCYELDQYYPDSEKKLQELDHLICNNLIAQYFNDISGHYFSIWKQGKVVKTIKF